MSLRWLRVKSISNVYQASANGLTYQIYAITAEDCGGGKEKWAIRFRKEEGEWQGDECFFTLKDAKADVERSALSD